MNHADACAARDLEARELYRAAAELRAASRDTGAAVELGRAVREAEARGDWRRWAALLERLAHGDAKS